MKQKEIAIFFELGKENDKNTKNIFKKYFLISDFTFNKEALCFIMFILALCSNMLILEGIFEFIRQKLKNHASFKILSRHEVFTRLFFFFSSLDEISSLPFWQGWVQLGIKIVSLQKHVNSKRQFTIDRADIVLGQVSSRYKTSRVNTLQV